jgi:hypothetical protein
MPATTSNPAKVAANGHAPARYVKCDLSRDQKEHLAAWAEELEWVDLMAWVDKMTSDYRVISLKHIADVNGYQCAVTTQRGSGDEGKTLMARGSTATKALVAAMYRDVVVLQGIWTVVTLEAELDL